VSTFSSERLRAYLMVRWLYEGLSPDCSPAVVFARSADEAKMLWSRELHIGPMTTTSKDWDAREIRTLHATRTCRVLARWQT
jgi:hypothetical protein